MFGALVYKPQLALMIPIALIASRRWTTFAAAALSAAALGAASYLIWGEPVWRGFLDAAPLARAALERHLVGDEKMQSVFAAVRLLNGPLALAYAAQGLGALAAAAALVWLQRRDFRGRGEGAALVAATLLASPFLLDYDLTLLALPITFLAREGLERGFAPFEESCSSSPICCRSRRGPRRSARSADRRADHRRNALFRRPPPERRTGAGRAIDRHARIIE